jgi:hypothetical protein
VKLVRDSMLDMLCTLLIGMAVACGFIGLMRWLYP